MFLPLYLPGFIRESGLLVPRGPEQPDELNAIAMPANVTSHNISYLSFITVPLIIASSTAYTAERV